MSYTISCVLLIPAEYRDTINSLADSLGYGPYNLSVLLVKSNGAQWFGCHTWCKQAFLDQLDDPQYASAARSALIISAVEGGNAASNWAKALESNSLSLASDE